MNCYPVEMIEIGKDINTGELIPSYRLDRLAKGWAMEVNYIFTGPWNDYRVIDGDGNDVSVMFAYELRKRAFYYQTER